MIKKILILVLMSLMIIGCQRSYVFRHEEVVDYFELKLGENEDLLDINGILVPGSIIFDFYFSSETTIATVEEVISDSVSFLSDEELLFSIREYYYMRIDTKDFRHTYPKLVINYQIENDDEVKFYYINDRLNYYDDKSKNVTEYKGWAKIIYE